MIMRLLPFGCFFIFNLLIGSGSSLFAQNPTIDSLRQSLEKLEGKDRFPTLMLFIDHTRTVDHDLSLQFLEEAGELIEADTTSKSYADLLLRQGREKAYQGLFGEAVALYFDALKKYAPFRDTAQSAYTLCDIGIAYAYSNKFEQANQYMRESLDLFEQIDHLKGQADMLNNLGSVMDFQGEQDSALVYYQRSLEIKKQLGNQKGIVNGLINIGVVYMNRNETDKALSYFTEATELAEIINDQEAQVALALNFSNLYSMNDQNLPESVLWAEKALALAERTGNNFRAQNASWKLANIHKKMGEPQKALDYLYQYVAYTDSLSVEENQRQLKELDARYQNELKEQQIKFLNQEKALQTAELKQRQQLLIFVSVLLVLAIALGGALILYLKTRQKQKQLALDHRMRLKQAEAERLKELDEVKSQFFANIAHEFRTPLTLIMGPAEQIKTSSSTPKNQRNAELIGRSATKLLELVNQLLDLSKLEAGMMQLHTQESELIDFVKGITYSFESLASEKKVALYFSTNCPEAWMPIDAERTDKIFVNLLSNAFKFTPEGRNVSVEIRLKADSTAQNSKPTFAEITVRDSGTGISPELLPHIFTRFYQVTSTGMGTGIGLALVKELVELHGGTVEAQSTVGKGTAFTVRLPITRAGSLIEPKPLPVNQLLEQKQSPATTSSNSIDLEVLPNSDDKPVVLIVEDNEEVRKYTIKCLWENYHVLEATNGQEGIDMALRHLPDLVISDVMMPKKDGLQVCRELKQDQKTSHIPLILLTAKADVDHKIEGLETGADDYLSKPFHQGELKARVGNIIQSREEWRRKFSEAMAAQPEELPHLPHQEDAFLEKIKLVLDANLSDEQFGIEQLCLEIGMSRTQLHRKLKALTNLSTSHFVRHFRLNRALQLLKEERHSVAEVAYQVGFSSPSYFTQCFSEVFGFAPSALVKE